MQPVPLAAARAAALGGAFAALDAADAETAFSLAAPWLARDEADIEAALATGLALGIRGEAADAAPLLQRVARARPGFAHPGADFARLCRDPARVAALFAACAALAETDTGLAYAQADFLLDQGDATGAIAAIRRGLSAAPEFAPGHNMLGMALLEAGDAAAAIAAFRRAAALTPDEGAVWTNLGMALKVEGRFEEAVAAHDRAVALAPGDPRLRLNRAIALLRAGRMAAAWPDYECRLAPGDGLGLPRDRMLPAVTDLDLRGRTVLAWHEEGFGDTLQFGRYLPLLAARGARVLARLPPPLIRLFAGMPDIEVLPAGAPIPSFDFHVPVFSLPRAFATTLETIPAAIPYLRADPALVAAWAPRLPRDGRLRVGVVWAGQARPWLPFFTALDRRRSAMLADLAPLTAVPGIRLVSLQMGAPAAAPRPPDIPLFDPMADVRDFADTAAILDQLDVLVSVDTSVVHLAGALGRPVLLLDRYDSCWRWLAGREDSPWYPSLRILRQTVPGDWSGPVARAAALLNSGDIPNALP
jgi:tetratricopeptide (TPR) repeat protein